MKKIIFAVLGALVVGLSACGSKNSDGGNMAPPGPQYPYIVPPGGGGGNYTNALFSSLGVTNRNAFEALLEFSGRCVDSDGVLYGSNRCSLYSDQGYVQILLNGATTYQDGARVDVIVTGGVMHPSIPYRYSSDWGGWVIYPIPMQIPMTYRAINNNQGFVLQDMGNFGYPSGRFRVTVNAGQITAQSLSGVLSYNGVDFANATLVRY